MGMVWVTTHREQGERVELKYWWWFWPCLVLTYRLPAVQKPKLDPMVKKINLGHGEKQIIGKTKNVFLLENSTSPAPPLLYPFRLRPYLAESTVPRPINCS